LTRSFESSISRSISFGEMPASENFASKSILEPLYGGLVDTTLIREQWGELMRLAISLKAGSETTPSEVLRKLAAAGPTNVLSRALQAVGRVERALFTLKWISDAELRQRTTAGLNKGESEHALRRAVFFNREGEFRDRTLDNQSFRASGLSLLVAIMVYWNTIYLTEAVRHARSLNVSVPDEFLSHVAPLGWEHIGLTGDYIWTQQTPPDQLRLLRDADQPFLQMVA
jgi:TnpA family transposase